MWTRYWQPARAMGWLYSAPICKSWSAATANSATASTKVSARIRANQGYGVDVDLQLGSLPPELLYHGTAERSVEAIAASGLLRMARHHVHLSADVETARQMGVWHGRPVVLEIAAARMGRDSYPFYRSDNGVWLIDRVPPEYIALPTARDR